MQLFGCGYIFNGLFLVKIAKKVNQLLYLIEMQQNESTNIQQIRKKRNEYVRS